MPDPLQIKHPESEINEQAPWCDDRLKRKECADKLTSILANQHGPLTIALNGEWGSGKTFMLKRWRQQLKNDGYTAIYFNAWEDDFVHDPLVALLGQLWLALGCKRYNSEVSCEESFPQAVLNAAKNTDWRGTLRAIAEGLTEHVSGVKADELRENDKTPEYRVLDRYLADSQSRTALRTALSTFAKQVFDITGKPVIFIIDELDRCRPTFAIEVLERVKHLFNIDQMIFVLGIDRKQLGTSIQSVYGNIGVENYLHRFVDLDLQLPLFPQKEFFDAAWERYGLSEYLGKKSKESGSDIEKNEGANFKQIFSELCKLHRFTLREIEQSFKIYTMLLNGTPLRHFSWPYLVAVLIILKLRHNTLYQQYVAGSGMVLEIVDAVLPVASFQSQDHYEYDIIEAAIYASFMNDYPKTPQEMDISELVKTSGAGKPLKGMSSASNRLQCLSEEDNVKQFAYMVARCRDRWHADSQYRQGATVTLGKMMDMLSFDIPEEMR